MYQFNKFQVIGYLMEILGMVLGLKFRDMSLPNFILFSIGYIIVYTICFSFTLFIAVTILQWMGAI